MSSFFHKLYVFASLVTITLATTSFEVRAGDDENHSDRGDRSENRGESRDQREDDDDDSGDHGDKSSLQKPSAVTSVTGPNSALGTSNVYAPEAKQNNQSSSLSQNDARVAVQHGKARKLKEVIRAVNTAAPGNIISVNLRSRGDNLIYDIKVLTKQQTVKTISINANTLSIY